MTESDSDADDLSEEIDALARKVERTIQRGREFLDSLPEFEKRSEAAKKMERVIKR